MNVILCLVPQYLNILRYNPFLLKKEKKEKKSLDYRYTLLVGGVSIDHLWKTGQLLLEGLRWSVQRLCHPLVAGGWFQIKSWICTFCPLAPIIFLQLLLFTNKPFGRRMLSLPWSTAQLYCRRKCQLFLNFELLLMIDC